MIHKIILGTVQFGMDYGINNPHGLMCASEVKTILEIASSEGIRFLDTAADYGESEKRIGLFIKGNSLFNIITKFSKKKNINWKESLKQSLINLEINQVDTAMFHSYDSYLKSKDILKDIIDEGKNSLFKRIGVSVYTNEELNHLIQDNLVEVVQCPFNILDNQRLRADNLIKLKKSGKTIHTRSVFLQGLFFLGLEKFPVKLSPLSTYCAYIRKMAIENDISLGHLALQYVLNKKYIDGVLIGVDSVEQLKTNLQWIHTPVPQFLLSQIDQILVLESTLLNPAEW